MMVSMDAPVAARVIGAASASVRPVWPDAALLYVVFVMLGAFVGYVAHGLRREEAQQAAQSYQSWVKRDARANDGGEVEVPSGGALFPRRRRARSVEDAAE